MLTTNRKKRKLARQLGSHKTSILTENGITKIIYHSTCVVSFNHEMVQLNSNGWQTATTKTRMNQASNQFDLGFTVYQKDFTWFVEYQGKTLEFFDHMILERD